MSRRIFFVPILIALIWSAALIATKAVADRECFEDSCRETEAAEPPPVAAKSEAPQVVAEPQPAQTQAEPQAQPHPAVTQASAIPEVVPPEIPKEIPMTVVSEPAAPAAPAPVARPDNKLMPASVLPKVAAEPALPKVASGPAPRTIPPQASTRAEDARIRREPPRVAPSYAETRKPLPVAAPVAAPPVPPVRAVNVAVPTYVRPERPPQPAYIPPAVQTLPSDYVVRQQRPSTATAAVVEVPGEIQTGDGLVTVHPNLRHDPAWKLCQIDSRDLGRRNYRCTAYSYQPYGEGGYRPYGTYRSYQATPGYVVAPNARIISIDPND